MSSLGVFSAFFFAAAAQAELVAPENLIEPVLIARQSGTDMAWSAPNYVDYPNGAWGIEVIIPDERVVTYRPTDAAIEYEWRDLATDRHQAQMLRTYLNAREQYVSGNAKTAASLWNRSAELARKLGDAELEMHSSYLETVAFVRLGQHDDAIVGLEALIELFPEQPFALFVKYALGSAMYRRGEDMDGTRSILQSVAMEANTRGDHYTWAVASRQHCYTYLKHDEKLAADCLEKLAQNPRLKNIPVVEATVLNTFAQSLDKLGESLRARDILKDLLELRKDLGNQRGIATTYMSLAHVDRKLGQSLKSLTNYLQAYEILTKHGMQSLELTAVIALGELYLDLGDVKTAESWFELAAGSDTDLDQELAYATLGLAQVQLETGDLQGAQRSLNRIPVLEHTNLALRTETMLTELAVNRASSQALSNELIDKTLAAATTLGESRFIAEARYYRALTHAENERWDLAKQDIATAMNTENPLLTQLSATLLEADRLYHQNDLSAAQRTLEDAIELESKRIQQAPSWHINNSTQRELWSRAIRWAGVNEGDQSQAIWALDIRRRSLGRSASRKQLSFADRNTTAMSVLTSAARQAMADEVINIEQLRQLAKLDAVAPNLVEPGTASYSEPTVPTISYWLDEQVSVAIYHDGQAPTVRALPNEHIRSLQSLVSQGRTGVYDQQVLARASEVLISPLADLLPDSGPLNIAIDGYLAALPFELLPTGNWTMLDMYDIAYVHYPLVAGPEHIALESAAAIVNPEYAGELAALTQSIGEAELIEHYFPQATIAQGRQANRGMLDSLSDAPLNVLHLGVHARASVEWSAWSGLWMGGPEFVSAREVAASHYPVDLVFLSACSTSVGSFELTGTTQTLSLAWLMAGSKSVISTLWDVSDAGAYEFSAALYENLKTQSLRTAVANAKRTMVQSGIWSDPQFWAPFQLWVG